MNWVLAALVIAGWLSVFVSLRRSLTRTSEDLRKDLQRQIDSLSASVRALEQPIGKPTLVKEVTPPGVQAQASAATSGSDEITPETLAAIADTITALLGRKIHIRSVKVLGPPHAIPNPWAVQGRAVIQASHNRAQQREKQ